MRDSIRGETTPSVESQDSSDDPRLWEVVSDFERELNAGRRPDRRAYLERYPELASAIAQCLDGLEALHVQTFGKSTPAHGERRSLQFDSSAKLGSTPLGDFQIIGEIARGGMGVVYEAVQLSLGRRVALKVLPFAATLDPRHLQRFKIEAQAAALLHHTHIVPIYAVGCERGVHFYAMQLIEGQSLAEVLHELRVHEGRSPASQNFLHGDQTLDDSNDQDRKPASPNNSTSNTFGIFSVLTAGNAVRSDSFVRRAARLMIQAADALEHAHQAGVVHRDIKPANLLVDRTGSLWITDFGLAQLHSENGVTRSSDMLGTFRYMSPEQTGGQRTVLDHRTDIYSLGATFYELVTLEPVFSASTHQELFYQILHSEPRAPRDLNRAISPELETILLKALSKSPVERYATFGELAADLQRFLDHKPILARRPTALERFRKWLRRNPSIVATAVLLLTVVAVGSLVSAWLISNEQSRTAAALEGQELRAEEAEARFKQAREAVDVLFQISEEELSDKPLDGARKRILQVVLTHYEEFIEQRRHDETARAELAQAQEKVKSILYELMVLQSAMDRRLLENSAVQNELKLDESQREQLSILVEAWKFDGRELIELFQTASEADRRSHALAIGERQQAELERLLSADQWTRFQQLALQSRGLLAFRDNDIVQALGLNSDQRANIREIERQMFAERFRPHGPGKLPIGPPPERRGGPKLGPGGFGPLEPRGPWGDSAGPRARKTMKAWVDKALALLTERQIAIWKSLTGEHFTEFDREFLPGPPW